MGVIDMSGSRSLNNSTSKRVLNVLEPVKLTVWEVMIERVTVVKRVLHANVDIAIHEQESFACKRRHSHPRAREFCMQT